VKTKAPTSVGTRQAAFDAASLARLRQRRRRDKLARWIVSLSGAVIIALILGILLFILVETAPLTAGAEVVADETRPLAGIVPAAMVLDDHLTNLVALGADGVLRLLELPSLGERGRYDALTGRPLVGDEMPDGVGLPLRLIHQTPSEATITAATSDGRVLILPVPWVERFVEQTRIVELGPLEPIVMKVDPSGRPLASYGARATRSGTVLVMAQIEGGSIRVMKRFVSVNDFTGESEESVDAHEFRLDAMAEHLLVDKFQKNAYAAAGTRLWDIPLDGESGRPGDPVESTVEGGAITALSFLKGNVSLMVGQSDGAFSVWFHVPQEGGRPLRRIRGNDEFPPRTAKVRHIVPSFRNKGFIVHDDEGGLGLYYSTSERTLWEGESPVGRAVSIAMSPKDDAAVVAGERGLAILHIENPHPAVGFNAYFGNVWYEGFPEPAMVWQSSSGDDDYEPKYSLVPLIVGTLKGTFFSLLFAVPLAVMAALYASQFLHPTYRDRVKPVVEIMAAMPSVVLGFVAGLWLARHMRTILPGMVAMIVILPGSILLAGWLWMRLSPGRRARFLPGVEIFVYGAFLALGFGLAVLLSAPLEEWLFAGDVATWLQQGGIPYDQQNALVVSVAMGFAVIPIIFTISEEAFSSVPRTLPLGSLALGASKWQTVVRVVIPSASPGVFSAIMVGFGRAVGETMIILMAAGNTPIKDWNPFTGFRTLSSNIATEIPEAPQGETLFRTLFLSALMLFILTFAVNTLAEVIRGRLRRRYASL
jgi:phosphate transport system permease protein